MPVTLKWTLICVMGAVLMLDDSLPAPSRQRAPVFAGESARSMPPDGNPRTIYISTGDNQQLLSMYPLDSKATIEAVFDAIHTRYRADRIWWRGAQEELWANEFVFRPANRQFARIWQWWTDLARRVVP